MPDLNRPVSLRPDKRNAMSDNELGRIEEKIEKRKATDRQGTLLAVDRGRVPLTRVQRVLVEGEDIGAFCSELLCKAGGA